MSPEILSPTAEEFFEESLRLKDRLLVIENKRHQAAYEATKDDVEETRAQQGIDLDELALANLLKKLIDTRIEDQKTRISAELVAEELPLTKKMAITTLEARSDVEKIIMGEDGRIFVIVGPCSVHDPIAALKFLERFSL
jgi:hypothetical protein